MRFKNMTYKKIFLKAKIKDIYCNQICLSIVKCCTLICVNSKNYCNLIPNT